MQWGQTSNELVKFTYDDHVWAVLSSVDSNHNHVLSRVSLKTELSIVNAGSTAPTLTEHAIPWLVRCINDDRVNWSELLNYLFRVKKYERIVVLRVNDRDGRVGIMDFNKGARRIGHPVLMELRFRNGDQDFSEQLTRLAGLQPQAFVLWANPYEAARIVKQMRAKGMTQEIVGSTAWRTRCSSKRRAPRPKAWCSSPRTNPDRQDSRSAGFIARYTAKYGSAPDTYAAHGYDGARLIVEAVRKAGLNRVKIRRRDLRDPHVSRGERRDRVRPDAEQHHPRVAGARRARPPAVLPSAGLGACDHAARGARTTSPTFVNLHRMLAAMAFGAVAAVPARCRAGRAGAACRAVPARAGRGGRRGPEYREGSPARGRSAERSGARPAHRDRRASRRWTMGGRFARTGRARLRAGCRRGHRRTGRPPRAPRRADRHAGLRARPLPLARLQSHGDRGQGALGLPHAPRRPCPGEGACRSHPHGLAGRQGRAPYRDGRLRRRRALDRAGEGRGVVDCASPVHRHPPGTGPPQSRRARPGRTLPRWPGGRARRDASWPHSMRPAPQSGCSVHRVSRAPNSSGRPVHPPCACGCCRRRPPRLLPARASTPAGSRRRIARRTGEGPPPLAAVAFDAVEALSAAAVRARRLGTRNRSGPSARGLIPA